MKNIIEEYFGFLVEVIYMMIIVKGFIMILQKIILQ